MPKVDRTMWWLGPTALPDLHWARLRVFDGGTAEVLDLDGKIHPFDTEQAARLWLLEDEYESFENLDDEHLANAGLSKADLVPPTAQAPLALVPLLRVLRPRSRLT
jgi:hypothetical protein